jgi:hypothetical protein
MRGWERGVIERYRSEDTKKQAYRMNEYRNLMVHHEDYR